MRRAAVLISVKKAGALTPLQATEKAAEAMRKWADSQRFDVVTPISDETRPVDATAIKRAITPIVDDPGGFDQLVVYFTGHGMNNGGSEYWLLSDAPRDTQAAVNVEESVVLARQSTIPHVVLISDACRTAAQGIQEQRVTGSEIFPNDGPTGRDKKVDQFFASIPGSPAVEVRDRAVAAAGYTAVYTEVLAEALSGSHESIVETTQESNTTVGLVRPTPVDAVRCASRRVDPRRDAIRGGALMAQLLLVHGRAQEFKEAAALKADWIDAFRRGLAKSRLQIPIAESDVRFPYYGQTLNDLIVGMDGPPADVIIKGTALDPGHADLLRSVVDEIRTTLGISDADVAAVADADVVEKGPLNWGWVQATLRVIDEHVPGAGVNLALFTYDVYQYLGNPGIRDVIEKGVRDAIPPGVSTVVVGHSLGSVVSYALLGREGQAKGWKIPLYVTLGSPLGVNAIRRRLVPISHPACVATWFNARDPRDVVALYPLDAGHFPIDPKIANKNDVDNHTPNRHGIVGYLDDAEVARKIYDALT